MEFFLRSLINGRKQADDVWKLEIYAKFKKKWSWFSTDSRCITILTYAAYAQREVSTDELVFGTNQPDRNEWNLHFNSQLSGWKGSLMNSNRSITTTTPDVTCRRRRRCLHVWKRSDGIFFLPAPSTRWKKLSMSANEVRKVNGILFKNF